MELINNEALWNLTQKYHLNDGNPIFLLIESLNRIRELRILLEPLPFDEDREFLFHALDEEICLELLSALRQHDNPLPKMLLPSLIACV